MSNILIKGDGVFKIRNNVIYVHGSIDGKLYRLSTGKKISPTTKQWMKKNKPLDVLHSILDKEKNVIATNNFEQFSNMVLELTSSRRQKSSQEELERLFRNRILPTFKRFTLQDIKPLDIVNL